VTNDRFLPLLGAFVLGAGFAAGAAWLHTRSNCGTYRFIHPDFACGRQHAIAKSGYIELDEELRRLLKEKRDSGHLLRGAIYFRDLLHGPVLGIDEDSDFSPASLLKLPVALTYMTLEEERPGILSTPLRYSRESVRRFTLPDQIEIADSGLRPEQLATIEELLHATIAQSDNLAYYVLLEHLQSAVPNGSARFLRTFRELGIIDPADFADEVVSVRGYSSLFRILHNVSFLDAEGSERVLSWLAESSFTKGIVAGVPPGTVVAHKFGERETPGGARQLHDCGIVYFPDNPYLLCVMTKGDDWDELAGVIAEVSRLVWTAVEARAR